MLLQNSDHIPYIRQLEMKFDGVLMHNIHAQASLVSDNPPHTTYARPGAPLRLCSITAIYVSDHHPSFHHPLSVRLSRPSHLARTTHHHKLHHPLYHVLVCILLNWTLTQGICQASHQRRYFICIRSGLLLSFIEFRRPGTALKEKENKSYQIQKVFQHCYTARITKHASRCK